MADKVFPTDFTALPSPTPTVKLLADNGTANGTVTIEAVGVAQGLTTSPTQYIKNNAVAMAVALG